MVTMNRWGVSCPSTPTRPFGDGLQQAAGEHVFAVGREGMRHDHAAARAERQPFDVLVLRHDRADGVGRRARLGAGIANGQLGDAQGGGEIALEQQRRRRQRGRDVVEAEVAAVARQQIGDVDRDAEQIAHGVGVLDAVQAMQDLAAGVVLRRRGRGRGWRRARRGTRPARRAPGVGDPSGGIAPTPSFLTTRSHVAASAPGSARLAVSSASGSAGRQRIAGVVAADAVARDHRLVRRGSADGRLQPRAEAPSGWQALPRIVDPPARGGFAGVCGGVRGRGAPTST